jgi:hypothetical protein
MGDVMPKIQCIGLFATMDVAPDLYAQRRQGAENSMLIEIAIAIETL